MLVHRVHLYFGLFVVAMVTLLQACKTPQASASTADAATTRASSEYRIKGTIVRVESFRDTIDPNSPCGKEPCNALVEINEVLAPETENEPGLAAGNRIPVHFAFTLAPANQSLFPHSTLDLPGLQTLDQFEATIKHRPLEEQPNRFMVFNYTKISP